MHGHPPGEGDEIGDHGQEQPSRSTFQDDEQETWTVVETVALNPKQFNM